MLLTYELSTFFTIIIMSSFYIIEFLETLILVELGWKQANLSNIAMLEAIFEHAVYYFVLVQLTTLVYLSTKPSDHLIILFHYSLELS